MEFTSGAKAHEVLSFDGTAEAVPLQDYLSDNF